MRTTAQRLAWAVSLIGLLDSRRRSAEDPNLGSNIEQMLIYRELRELERDIASDPGPLAAYVAAPSVRRQQAARRA